MTIPPHWDHKHLISFLYVFIADSDFVVTEDEAIAVNNNLLELLQDKYRLPLEEVSAIIKEVKSFEMAQDDAGKMEVIRLLSEKIDLDLSTYEYLIKELDEIAQSDKYVSVEEHSLMFYVRLKFKKDYPQRDLE